jgi:MFS family permease
MKPIRDLLACFGRWPLVLLAASYGALSYFQYLFFYWIEHYFEQALHRSVQESRQAAFTINIAMAIGMACGGYMADACCQRFGRRWGYRVLALVAMVSSSIFAWIGMESQEPKRIVLLFALALGSLGLCEGIFWTTAPLLQQRAGGLACAFLNTIGNAVGFVAPVLTPWIVVNHGWPAALAVACVVCGMGAVLWFWIDPEPATTG